MANTVSTISYANTFGQWMVATDALIAENNILATGDYTKDSGTLYLSETTKNSLQANGSVVVQKQLLVQGVASSATIDNNLTVAGQVYFSNTTLGLTNSGQANINGLLVAQGPGIGLSVANNAYVGGNTTIRYNTITNTVQANSSVNTANASITGTTYTKILQANTSTNTATASVTGTTFTDILQANSFVNTVTASVTGTTFTNTLQANTSTNTATASVTGTTFTKVLQANTSINTPIISVSNSVISNDIQANNVIGSPTLLGNTITGNISITTPTITVGTLLDGNAASAFVNSLQVQGGGLTVNGNFTLTGTTVYASNTFQLSTGATSGISSYLQVARGSSGANAAFRWNEPQKYWDTLNVNSNTYYRILTNEYIDDTLTSTSTSNVATANVANTLNNQLTAANTFLQAAVVAAGSYANSAFIKANSAYDSQNTTGTYANAAFLQANGAFVQANSAYGSQNTTGTYANSAYTQANTATNNAAGASLYANGAFIQANAAFIKANTPPAIANSAALYANGAFIQANSSYARANTSANTFVGTTGSVSQSSGVISFSSNNGVTVVATTANNLAISTSQDLRTTASPTFVGATFSQPVVGTTMVAGTSNTALATTAYVQNLANNSGTLTTNITGNAGTVTNGVYTNGSYSDPSWITSLANTKITGVITSSQLANTAVTTGTYGSSTQIPTITIDQQGRITNAANAVSVTTVLSTLYPVGCIYTSTVSTNPNTLFGFGTWTRFGQGRVLLSADDSTYTAGSTGGSANTTLTTSNLPSHSHSASVTDPGHSHNKTWSTPNDFNRGGISTPGVVWNPDDQTYGYQNVAVDSNTTGISVSIGSTGSGTAVTTISPYIVVYMWTRTA